MNLRQGILKTACVGTLLTLAAFSVSAQETSLMAIRVISAGALTDVNAAYWNDAPALAVPMQPQRVTTPMNPNAGIKELKVKAAHNGQWFAFLIEWPDPTKSERIVVDQFGDQVAVELPIKYNKGALPSPMMGQLGGRVTILQWRAAFQHDIDQGEPQIRDLYPYALVDVYPDQVLRATDARPYMGAIGVDNPISHPRHSPVLDQMAEGWGTLTVKPEQHAEGNGVWQDGRWHVIISQPMATESENDPQLRPGNETVAAFAVWDGGNREVGARKAWSNWVPLKFEQ